VITQYFKPDITAAAFRMSDLYDNLSQRNDVDLDLITTCPHKTKGDIATDEEKDNIYRIKLPNIENSFLLKYLVEYIYFSLLVIFKYFKIKKNKSYDYIFFSSPPLFIFFPAFFISLISKAKLITDIRDLWPDSVVVANVITKNSIIYKMFKKLENLTYKKSDHIFTVSESMKDYISKNNKNVTVIYNGISNEEIEFKKKLPRYSKNNKAKIDIYYAGNIGIMQDLKFILRAFNKKRELRDKFNLKLIGDGSKKKEIERYIEKNNLTNVELLGQFPKEKTLEILNKNADVLLINLLENELFEMAIPSKLFDYLLLNKPLLIGLKGNRMVIRQFQLMLMIFANPLCGKY
jgi:glycosyltransferase involved in cell wall biosynthesis